MNQTTSPNGSRVSLPEGLESPRAKLCYTYLSVSGPSTVGELTSALGLRRLDLLPLLETLQRDEWVRREADYVTLEETQ
jgi:DNA-binding MarR family transcriptional regulator